MGTSFHGASLGNLGEGSIGQTGVGSSTMDLERWLKEALGMECYSPKRLSSEGLWGAFLYSGPWKIC
jgi:hypothetical protein